MLVPWVGRVSHSPTRQPLTYILKPHMLELSADARLPQDSNLGLLVCRVFFSPKKINVMFSEGSVFFSSRFLIILVHMYIRHIYIYDYLYIHYRVLHKLHRPICDQLDKQFRD